MSNCDETLEELQWFLDKELPDGMLQSIQTHLGACTDCLQAFEFHAELRTVIARKVLAEEMPDGLMDKIRGCFGDDLTEEKP